jgi:fructosamine-3-kinase
LLPYARVARAVGNLSDRAFAAVDRVCTRLGDGEFDDDAPPARIHGDLWAGNVLYRRSGRSGAPSAVLIDPAAHGGHREFDLAMMRLFGGFGDDAYAAYDECFPLADGWEQRVPLHQIAPLVVHAIKFGGSYRAAAQAAISRYPV